MNPPKKREEERDNEDWCAWLTFRDHGACRRCDDEPQKTVGNVRSTDGSGTRSETPSGTGDISSFPLTGNGDGCWPPAWDRHRIPCAAGRMMDRVKANHARIVSHLASPQGSSGGLPGSAHTSVSG
ncbi:hypothetical protein PDE_04620 [Penicillium oxalicum 114-2]|uniref:Uncharacterized protein n=1 Tax=Penicillium oxalicum (strain 114-2 / CGMCC 5302) TaxID=933388 RepID=S7ZG51_PENO1|nr:hypothetical protein PDE_04620 [Penicillium oxalicum 114-2]